MKTKSLLFGIAILAMIVIVSFVRRTSPTAQIAPEQEQIASVEMPTKQAAFEALKETPQASFRPSRSTKPALFNDSESKVMEHHAGLLRAMIEMNPEVKITNEELEKILPIYALACLQREKLENSITKVVEKSQTHIRLQIPAYPQEGRELEKKFYAQLESVIGRAQAADIQDAMGGEIAQASRGWGQAAQDIVIESSKGIYTVQHSVQKISMFARLKELAGIHDPTAAVSNTSTSRVMENDAGEYAGKVTLLSQG